MIEISVVEKMGSQTLEILRQGVWASLTGGWFYDPHQDVFCNTFHLYIWLFLLCLPFTIYVYFPPTRYIWYFYCASVTIVLTVIKIVNYGLHHMYDTSECIREEVEDEWTGQKREEEGIELQVLSNKTNTTDLKTTTGDKIHANESAAGTSFAADADRYESTEFNPLDIAEGGGKPGSTIDLKAEVHRKNSSESSDGFMEVLREKPPKLDSIPPERTLKHPERRLKHQRSKTDGFVSIDIHDEAALKRHNSRFQRLYQEGSTDSQESDLLQLRSSLNSMEASVERSESNLNLTENHPPGRRHSNFTNCSLNMLPTSVVDEIKPTGSLELDYTLKEAKNVALEGGLYFTPKKHGGIRRIRSTALEICCRPPFALTEHPNSLELINCNENQFPVHLLKNPHLFRKFTHFFGGDIIFPIWEQIRENLNDIDNTDADSLTHYSDSDFETDVMASCSKHIKNTALKNVPYHDVVNQEKVDDERTSATSKDALLLDNENSNSSATPEMQDARELSECSCSNTSVDCDEQDCDMRNIKQQRNKRKIRRSSTIKAKSASSCSDKKFNSEEVLNDNACETNTFKDSKFKDVVYVRKRKSGRKSCDSGSCSSELDLDWLFVDEDLLYEDTKLMHRTEPLKRDNEWSGTTTVSLEHDVSKVLQDPVPSTRSLGAIPKKTPGTRVNSNAISSRYDHQSGRKTPKSESEKCSMCRCVNEGRERSHNRHRSMKENKLTQTLRPVHCPVPVGGLEWIVYPRQKMQGIGIPKRRSGRSNFRHNQPSPSSSSNNELSTLLPPPPPLLSEFSPFSVCLPSDNNIRLDYVSPQRTRLKRNRVNRRRSNRVTKRDNAIATSLTAGHGTHSAKNFNDTSDGSVHCFMDEKGNWITYTFDEKGIGTANKRLAPEPDSVEKPSTTTRRRLSRDARNNNNSSNNNNNNISKSLEIWDSNNSTDSICNSSVSVILDAPPPSTKLTTNSMIPIQNTTANPYHAVQIARMRRTLPESVRRRLLNDQCFDPMTIFDNSIISSNTQDNETDTNQTRNRFKFIQATAKSKYPKTKTYYKLKLSPWTSFKVSLDRLKLLALLDRNLTFYETFLSTFLGILVSILGAILLYLGFYQDLLAFIFCFIIASCQYSLLKSVQPDAASPTHGFNRVIAYSRPIYFSLIALVILILQINLEDATEGLSYEVQSFNLTNQQLVLYSRDFLIKFILFFPLLFSLGLFPQINTFVMYVLEQIDMHLFGGNAMSSLSASFYCVFRSLLAVFLMTGLAYGALSEERTTQHILFSMFCSSLIACSYHLSRSASDPSHLWNIVKQHVSPDVYREHRKTLTKKNETGNDSCSKKKTDNSEDTTTKKVKLKCSEEKPETVPSSDHVDPLPHKLQKTVNARLKNDVILCGCIAILVFGIHASTVFTALKPELSPVLWMIAVSLGFVLHYVIPQFRKQLPWLCIGRPILRSYEYGMYQIRGPAKIMWFERVYMYFCFLERNIIYPLMFLSSLTADSVVLTRKHGVFLGSFIIVVCGLKCLRMSYSDQNMQFLILAFTVLYFRHDNYNNDESENTFLDKYFIMSIVFHKIYELLLKIQFVVTYIAPWQITWGSAFHAFAQPFSVPHSAMLFLQAVISAILSTPLNPFLGSAIFLTSYVRPVKFWERDYNTRRVDHSNTPLSSHLDRNLGADDNNLNSIFYEHLTRSLQHSLCGDLILGRWGKVNQGDCFVLASDYLNCLVHIIELGNGLVTFQMRGLEFRGTYCQQREVEAITEGVEENDGCCCCDTGHLPNMLSVNAAFSQRWLAWEVTASKYILEGYSISDNSAISMLQVFEFRKVLVSYYVKSIIFYTVRSPKLEEWLTSQTILKALQPIQDRLFVDLDPVFNYNIDEDYDIQNSGMTRNMFCQVHGDWITYCVEKIEKPIECSSNSTLVLLCFALSLLGRRTLGAVSHNTVSSVEFFLYGLHALFKGDFRITCARDEWVFTDMDLLKTVVAPGVRMSLKLHQDHFMSPYEYEELPTLYEAICKHEEELVISHEGDPAWRNAVLSGTPSLLALRHVLDDGSDEYKIIMLNKRYLSFRVIKINKECVRGLWAGQQQELVYLRNRNPERGSIQNAKQALRNIINSSCDQPIGYPIYVSPLTTSYAETNEQYCQLVGGSVSFTKIRNFVFNLFRKIRKRCGEGCSSGGSARDEICMGHEGVYAMTPVAPLNQHTAGSQSTDGSHLGGSMGRGSSLSRTSLGANRGSLVSMGKPTSSTLASLAGLFKERDERAVSQTPDAEYDSHDKEYVVQRVLIVDPNVVYDGINLGRRIDVTWPTEYMRIRGGRSHWKDWVPEAGMEGHVVHKWMPCHRDPGRRSHVDRTILLVQIDDKFVPIAECGVQNLGEEV